MNEFFANALFSGVVLSLIAYFIGAMLKRKFKLGLFNPLFDFYFVIHPCACGWKN